MRGLFLLVLAASCTPVEPPAAERSEAVNGPARSWQDEILYQIVVDRFANGDPTNDAFVDPNDLRRHQGGDWRGVADHMDYVRDLGATALWISPLVDNVARRAHGDGYHGYWPRDFTQPNPRFGTLEDLAALVEGAHARDLRVIADVVLNHAGNVFFYDLDEDGVLDPGEEYPPFSEKPYESIVWHEAAPPPFSAEHFHRRGQTETFEGEERELGDFPTGLRDLDTENPVVVDLLVENALEWIERTGIDGFRLDAVPHAPRAFWSDFAARIRARAGPDFLLLGEVFDANPQTLGSYDMLDSVFDFSLKAALDAVILDGAPVDRLAEAMSTYRALHEPEAWRRRVVFADNHDLPRMRGQLDDPAVTALAMTVIFTLDGLPCVYYGTEQGLRMQRAPLHSFDRDGFEHRLITRLAELRRDLPALTRGSLTIRHAAGSLIAWERRLKDQRVLIALNTAALDSVTARFSTGFAPGAELREVLFTDDRVFPIDDQGALRVRLPPRTATILK